jgi:putative hydrolase of the HAD superfamily
MGSETDRVELVLFDLSGVLADFRGAQALGEMVGLSEEQVWPKWLQSPWMRRFDLDQCSAEEFSAGIVDEWELRVTPAEFLEAFSGWMIGPYDGATELVQETRSRTTVGCLSNMNPIHWHEMCDWPMMRLFQRRFVSCEIALVKPDRKIYEYVTDFLVIDPDRVLFLDDNMINVEGALACGFRGAHVRGVKQAEAALRAHGILVSAPGA